LLSRYAVVETRLGQVVIGGSDAGLRLLTLPRTSVKAVVAAIEASETAAVEDASAFGDLPLRLQRYFEGEDVELADKPDFGDASDFGIAVWSATRSIPFGETRSYAWVARQIGASKACRAVGGAMGRNPLPIIVPCHRVITGDGRLGGFGGGLDMKKQLLRLETPGRPPGRS
jgi:methylated-DNA-[protein]-cysteine S-methyltransferase